MIAPKTLPPLLLAAALFLPACGTVEEVPPSPLAISTAVVLAAVVESEPVGDDPDDPAIWVHPDDPSLSLIVGTNKIQAPGGALAVFDLEGRILQTIDGLNRPNNVDIETRVRLDGVDLDIVAVTERLAHAVRLYAVEAEERRLRPLGQFPVFAGETGEFQEPMGIALYKRPADGAVFILLTRAAGPADGYVAQYALEDGPSLRRVRTFGRFSGEAEIEAIAVDDALGYVYYADELAGIRKYHADPDHPDAARELAFFGRSGYTGDREGIAIYPVDGTTGYIVSTDQVDGGSRYLLYRREGAPGAPHDHGEVVAVLEAGADATDGIEVTPVALDERFPRGLLVVMNSGPRNFLFLAWPDRSVLER